MVDKTNDKYAKLQRALKHVNRIQNSVDTARKKSGVDRIATDKHGNTVYKKEVKEMKKKDKAPSSSKQNPVAKHMRTFNKATVQRDRKKDAKRGYKKHSNAYENMQIDELSDDGLHSYISKSMKASDQAHARKYAAHNSANNAKTDSSAARLRKVSKGHAAIQKKRDAGIQQALKKVTGRAKVNATESAEKVDEGIAHYKIHRSNNNGRTWDHSPGDSYVSLSRAKEISGNMKHTGKHTPGFKVKITKHEKPKLAGPVGKLPESAEKVQESIGHVRMDRLSASAHKKVVSLLKNHEKNGSIKHDGDTDKGALFKLLKPNHHSKIHSDLRKHGAGFEIDESVEQLAEDKTLTRDQLPKKVEAVVKKVFKVIDKYKKYRGTVSVEKHGTKYTVFIAVGRNGADDEDYTGDLMSIIPWEKRKTSNIEIDVAGSVYPAPKNIIIRESLDNAKSEKDSAQMKLRHANQKVRLAKKQEREKGAVAERKETDSAAKKPEKYTKADGTIGTRMVPAHKEVQKESVEQVEEAYFSVQFRDEKGKADSSSKNFKSASAAKKHADMANKTTKVGSYSVQKVQGRMESVEHIEEGLLNDIRDFIVAVGAAIPTKKNKQNKGLEGQIRSAMQNDPEFDKLVRNAAYVRKDGIVAFKAGSLSELQAYVRKTVDAKTAEKLGTLVQGYMETMRNGEKRNIRRSSNFTKKQKAGIKSGKIVYTSDMERTLQFTTDQIGKVIKRVTLAAHTKNMKEDVEQVDEISQGLKDRYVDKANKELQKRRTARFNLANEPADSLPKKRTPAEKEKWMRDARKRPNRHAGIRRAGAVPESVEQVDELSNKKLASYVSKASSDAKSRMKKGETDGVSRFGRKTDKRMDGIDRALNKMPGKKGSRDAGNRRTDGKVSGTGSMSVVDKMKANRSKGVAPKYYGEEVEQVDEISDKLVKNYRAKAVADLHNRLDKRGSVKGNVSSRQNPKGRDKLAKSIKKTKSNLDSAKKSVFNRDKKIAKAQSARDAAVSSFKDRKDNERRIKNRDRGIERTDRKADAADKKKPGSAAKRGLRGFSGYGESVEQVDENMFGYEGKNKIKIYHSDAKVHKSAVGSFPDHHSAEFDKKKKTTTIHLKKSVDKDTAGKIGRFDSNWKTRTSYHESTEYEDVIAEALSNVVVKKMQDMVGGPDKMPRGAEFRKLKAKAQAAVKAERSAKKAAPKAVTTTKTAKGKTHKGSADASERNIIMQLRKAQDLDGNSEVRISPKRSVKLSKKKIDALLKKHDALQKPVQKRAYIVMLTKALRGMK